jgi:hypothetical protein
MGTLREKIDRKCDSFLGSISKVPTIVVNNH